MMSPSRHPITNAPSRSRAGWVAAGGARDEAPLFSPDRSDPTSTTPRGGAARFPGAAAEK